MKHIRLFEAHKSDDTILRELKADVDNYLAYVKDILDVECSKPRLNAPNHRIQISNPKNNFSKSEIIASGRFEEFDKKPIEMDWSEYKDDILTFIEGTKDRYDLISIGYSSLNRVGNSTDKSLFPGKSLEELETMDFKFKKLYFQFSQKKNIRKFK